MPFHFLQLNMEQSKAGFVKDDIKMNVFLQNAPS